MSADADSAPALFQRFGDSNDAQCHSAAGIARRLRELVRLGMYYESMSDNCQRSVESDYAVHEVNPRMSAGVRLDIAEVADVPLSVFGTAVRVAGRIVMIAGRFALFEVRKVSEIVDMKCMFARSQASDLSAHMNSISFSGKIHDARHSTVADRNKHANGVSRRRGDVPSMWSRLAFAGSLRFAGRGSATDGRGLLLSKRCAAHPATSKNT